MCFHLLAFWIRSKHITGSKQAILMHMDVRVWQFMGISFVFHTLMLIAGAIWAYSAWGRYWAWDPLETSTLITWLTLGLLLHIRLTLRMPMWLGWLMATLVFVLAILTFFGMPFLSMAPHKGIV